VRPARGTFGSGEAGHPDAVGEVDRSRRRHRTAYRVERERFAGAPSFVVVSPAGERLCWFTDLPDAEAEADALSRRFSSG